MKTQLSRSITAFSFACFLIAGAIACWSLLEGPVSAGTTLRSGSMPKTAAAPAATATCTPQWNIMTSPNGSGSNELRGTASLSVDDVWAAGVQSMDTTPRTLIENWDGVVWTVVPSPNRGTGPNVLNAAAADSPISAWAVGAATGILILRWDGHSWALSNTPDFGPNAVLYGAAALAPDDAWAVGSLGNTSNETFILHWDGTSWSRIASPPVAGAYVSLQDIETLNHTDVWTVGYESDTMGIMRSTVALHWDGTSWARVATPNPGFEQQYLQGVTTWGPNDIWAVGYYHDTGSNPTWSTLIIHWNGTMWSQVASPNQGDFNYLYGVKVSPLGDVWAVGSSRANGSSNSVPLVEHYAGSNWVITPSTAVPGMNAGLLAVDICSTNHPRAVGSTGMAGSSVVLIEVYDECPTPTPTVTVTPCAISFSDVHPTDYFYRDVQCEYCRGAVSGYSDGTFRPFNNSTRGQMTKMIVLGLRIPVATPTGTPTFSDVGASDPFYPYIETLAALNVVSGYSDGTFRPNANITRGQLSKIDMVAAGHVFGWMMLNPASPTFSDVPRGSAFYSYIETAVCHGVLSGYTDGTFRPNANATRAQIVKILCHTAQNPPACMPPTATP